MSTLHIVLQAIGAGSKAIAETCQALESLQGQIGKTKRQAIPPVGQELQSLIEVGFAHGVMSIDLVCEAIFLQI